LVLLEDEYANQGNEYYQSRQKKEQTTLLIRVIGNNQTDYPNGNGYSALYRELDAVHFGRVTKAKTLYSLHDDNEQAIGLCGVIWFARSCRFVNAFMMSEHRGRGGYDLMMDYRIELARSKGVCRIEACCTDMSLPAFLKRGAVPIHYYERLKQTKVRLVL